MPAGFWRVLTLDNDTICVSYQTPLKDFARWVRVEALHEQIAVGIRSMFTGALICDEVTWGLLNDLAMNDLKTQKIEKGPIFVLGRMLLLEYSMGLPIRNTSISGAFPKHFSQAKDHTGSRSLEPGSSIAPQGANRSVTNTPSPLAIPDNIAPYLEVPMASQSPTNLDPTPLIHRSPVRPMIQLPLVSVMGLSSTPSTDTENKQVMNVFVEAQGRCRDAMSALDLSDAERARAEIRAAIALLGD